MLCVWGTECHRRNASSLTVFTVAIETIKNDPSRRLTFSLLRCTKKEHSHWVYVSPALSCRQTDYNKWRLPCLKTALLWWTGCTAITNDFQIKTCTLQKHKINLTSEHENKFVSYYFYRPIGVRPPQRPWSHTTELSTEFVCCQFIILNWNSTRTLDHLSK